MIAQPGTLFALDTGLWLIFYSDESGVAAIDLTREHPDIGYNSFEAALNFTDATPVTEKIVLLGGPERADNALLVLHEPSASGPDSIPLNEAFSFLSYTYVPLPGRPPVLIRPDNQPSELRLKKPSPLLISMGYRLFGPEELEGAAQRPATADLVFHTPRRERLARFLRQLN